jgi:RimJ/RimL family protein N-acetyltransferase
MQTLTDIYPPYALRVTSSDLELRVVRDHDIPELVALAQDGIHDPADMPFFFPWTAAPPAELPINMARHYWTSRAANTREKWSLECTVRRHGELLGVQAIDTNDFLVTRTGETGSWLARRFQGQGIGTRMRTVMCILAFDHLGFEEITSGAFVDNPASLGVSRKVGYRANGDERLKRRDDERAVLRRLVLAPEDLVRGDVQIEVEGLAEVRSFIGLDVLKTQRRGGAAG